MLEITLERTSAAHRSRDAYSITSHAQPHPDNRAHRSRSRGAPPSVGPFSRLSTASLNAKTFRLPPS